VTDSIPRVRVGSPLGLTFDSETRIRRCSVGAKNLVPDNIFFVIATGPPQYYRGALSAQVLSDQFLSLRKIFKVEIVNNLIDTVTSSEKIVRRVV
jgi:hypothetical protein